jgi:hypothetical protein
MPYEIKGGKIVPSSVTCDTCPVRKECVFDRPRYGGFKGPGQRARNVGYRIITDAVEGHSSNESFMACFRFMETLWERLRKGRERREDGKDGEIIDIIAQEGETVRYRTAVGLNSRGEVIKPPPALVEPLRAIGQKVNLDDQSPTTRYRDVKLTLTVPPLKEAMGVGAYDQETYRLQMERERAAADAEDARYAAPATTPGGDEGAPVARPKAKT